MIIHNATCSNHGTGTTRIFTSVYGLGTWKKNQTDPSGTSVGHHFQKHIHILYRCFQKWWYPQIIHFNRVFAIINHPFWGVNTPIFGNTHILHCIPRIILSHGFFLQPTLDFEKNLLTWMCFSDPRILRGGRTQNVMTDMTSSCSSWPFFLIQRNLKVPITGRRVWVCCWTTGRDWRYKMVQSAHFQVFFSFHGQKLRAFRFLDHWIWEALDIFAVGPKSC